MSVLCDPQCIDISQIRPYDGIERKVSEMAGNRREQLLAALMHQQFMTVQDVATLLGCSLTTARRELAALATTGSIQRTHGGAVATVSKELPAAVQQDPFADVKERIARAAAVLVEDGDTVGLSGGTTNLALAHLLRNRRIGAVTNALDVAAALVSGPNCRVMLLGGMLSPFSQEIIGPEAEEMLSRMSIDTLFVCVDGISVDAGATTIGALEAQIIRAMAAQSRRVVITADHRKIGRSALSRILPLSSIFALVTDTYPTAEMAALKGVGIKIIEA